MDKCQAAVHAAFCDNIDTRTVLESIRELITSTNGYIERVRVAGTVNRQLLRNIAVYITKIFDVLGMIKAEETVGFPSAGKPDKKDEYVLCISSAAMSTHRHTK